jgi:hypothetical protein
MFKGQIEWDEMGIVLGELRVEVVATESKARFWQFCCGRSFVGVREANRDSCVLIGSTDDVSCGNKS